MITLVVQVFFESNNLILSRLAKEKVSLKQVPVAKMLRKDDPILGPAAKTSGFKDVTLELLLTNRGGCWGVTEPHMFASITCSWIKAHMY